MDDLERVTTECLQRIDNFGNENSAAIAVNALAVAAFTAIGNFVDQLDANGALRTSAGVTKLSQTGLRRMGRTELNGFLISMARIARDIAKNDPTFVNKFVLPSTNRNDAALLETARAFLADAAAVEALFSGYGLPTDFLDTLQELINDFDAAINAQDAANRNRIDANATIDDIIDQALTARRTLLVIVPNIFAGNPGKLADWAAASHIEKLPKAKPAPTPQPTP
jgi:hypothetical protein